MKKTRQPYSRMYLVNEPDFKVWQLILNARTLLAKYRARELLQYGISRNYSWALNVIKSLGDKATPSEIAKYSPLEKHSITEMLNRMVNRGLILKEAKNNSREPLIKLTSEGIAAQKDSRKRESIHKAISVLTAEETQNMLLGLDKIIKNTNDLLAQYDEDLRAKKSKAGRKTSRLQKVWALPESED